MKGDRLTNLKLDQVQIDDLFWNKYIDLVDEVILPFQWELINDKVEGAEKSYCIQNLRVAAGEIEGKHQGMVFQDTDVAKWLEAVAYSLAKKRNQELEKLADEAIDLIAKAQCEDGYINTYYSITKKTRWSDLFEGHELYTAGHMIEAAVAYYEATGKEKFLNVVCRFADYIDTVFGAEDGKIRGYSGHPEVELALVKLYRATGKTKYLKLADFFVETRGEKPCYFMNEACIKNGEYLFPEFADFGLDYNQAHLPIREQITAEGHAVRAVYLYSAMADLAYEKQDKMLLKQCDELWNNIVEKRMYITGSIGSAAYGERFTSDYDLPNNTNYSETCATIGLAMFSNRMFQITRDGKYMDIVEKALYNTLLSGTALDGQHFFYVNPLEVNPEVAEHNPTMSHVKTVRQQWFGVACCPPNIARTLASMGNYICAKDRDTLYVNLFVSCKIDAEFSDHKVQVQVEANYPKSGNVKFMVISEKPKTEFTIAIRKPSFSTEYCIFVNGEKVPAKVKNGYIYLKRIWSSKDEITLELDVRYRFVRCNPLVEDNIGKVALMKGPSVYCLEEADNGKHLKSILIDTETEISEVEDTKLFGGMLYAQLKGKRICYEQNQAEHSLYSEEKPSYVEDTFKAVPYSCWNNRGKGEMIVWMRERDVSCTQNISE